MTKYGVSYFSGRSGQAKHKTFRTKKAAAKFKKRAGRGASMRKASFWG